MMTFAIGGLAYWMPAFLKYHEVPSGGPSVHVPSLVASRRSPA